MVTSLSPILSFEVLENFLFSYVGAKVIKTEDFIKRYFELTLLPHSGVSLLFTEISIIVLTVIDPCLASIIQGTIASTALINEIIVVLLAKFALQKAHEIPGSKEVASVRKQETESSC